MGLAEAAKQRETDAAARDRQQADARLRHKNSGYLDLSATFDVSGFAVTPHVGYQKVARNGNFSYTDYSLTVSRDLSGFVLSAAVMGADTKRIGGTPAYYYAPTGKDLGKAGLVLGVKKTFSF